MTSPISTRLFIEGLDITPDNQVLVFSNATAVGNYYGSSSYEYQMARTYFTGPYAASATMEFVRDSNGQRPHLIGANLGNSLPNVNNLPITLTFDGFTYSGNVNTVGAANLTEVALDVQNALNSNLTPAAVTTGDSITNDTVQFTGTLNMSQLYVTSIQSGGPVVVGGVLSGPGVINGPNYDAQIIAQRGKQGSGHYSTFSNSGTASGALTETYGILHIGNLVSGQIKAGDHLSGPGVMANTALVQDMGGGNWLVNNAQAINPNDTYTVTAPVLTVQSNQLQGLNGAVHDFLEVSVGGEYGFGQNPSQLSFASGSAADLLGLSDSGTGGPPGTQAMDSSPGGQSTSIAQMMEQYIARAPDPFGSFQSAEPRLDGAFEHWQQNHPSYAFLPNNHLTTTPAGAGYTWIGGSGNWDSGSSWTPTGGPPTASDTATINATGSYTVTISSADVAQAVILDSAGATIDDIAGGSLTVGGTLGIDTGTYDLLGGTLTAAHIRIQHGGLLEGSGTIGATVTNNSHIAVSSGTLDFERQVNSSPSKRGTDEVSGGALLEFNKKVFSSQDIDFAADGGKLGLTDPKVFFGHIHGFGASDVIGLAGAWSFESISHIKGTTDLVLASSGGDHTFVFAGDYTKSEFAIAPSGLNTTIKFA